MRRIDTDADHSGRAIGRRGIENRIDRFAARGLGGRIQVGVLRGRGTPVRRNIRGEKTEAAAPVDEVGQARRRVKFVARGRRARRTRRVSAKQSGLGNPRLVGLRRGLRDLANDERHGGIGEHLFARERRLVLRSENLVPRPGEERHEKKGRHRQHRQNHDQHHA
jgi:hypothetical protein